MTDQPMPKSGKSKEQRLAELQKAIDELVAQREKIKEEP